MGHLLNHLPWSTIEWIDRWCSYLLKSITRTSDERRDWSPSASTLDDFFVSFSRMIVQRLDEENRGNFKLDDI